MAREKFSLVIIAYNNADTLERCLVAADFADETVVLDSGSTDTTVEIARRHGARIAVHPFDDYGPQKQRAIDMAVNDWILNLDADEMLSWHASPRSTVIHPAWWPTSWRASSVSAVR